MAFPGFCPWMLAANLRQSERIAISFFTVSGKSSKSFLDEPIQCRGISRGADGNLFMVQEYSGSTGFCGFYTILRTGIILRF
jgi:hypothetical protein